MRVFYINYACKTVAKELNKLVYVLISNNEAVNTGMVYKINV